MSGDDWLWDGKGEPDPEVADLEKALRPLRYEGEPPKLARRGPPRWWALAIPAVALAAAVWLWVRPGWSVEVLEGTPCTDCTLDAGEWLATDGATRLRVEVADLGTMEVAPDTRLRLARSDREHRLELVVGRIDVSVIAPPRVLIVDTPAGSAVDLGCAYTLEVAPDGVTRIRVTAGMVSLEAPGRTSVVIHDTAAEMVPGEGPGLPVMVDASAAFAEAAHRFDREGTAADRILSEARPIDTITLWHLLQRVPEADRAGVFDRIAALVPGVLPTDREALLRLDPGAIEVLWRDLASTWGEGVQ